MYLIALGFGTIAWSLLGLMLLAAAYQLVWWLARLTDGLVGFLTHIGLGAVSKALLVILVNYDQKSYVKSRFMLWNQVPFRFALFWGFTLALTALLCLLKLGRSVDSIGQPLILIVGGYIACRCLLYWVAPPRTTLHSFNPEVKEQSPRSYSIVRRWDYLDELFAHS